MTPASSEYEPLTPPVSPRLSPTVPNYPRHPFSPDVCVTISRLPEGFRELALTGHLSSQLMRRLSITRSQVVHLMATATNNDRDQDWQSLLLASNPIERMTWLAVLVYHLRSSTYISNCKNLAKTVMECAQMDKRSQSQSQCLMWGASLVLATPDSEKALTRERETMIQKKIGRAHV